MHGLYFKRVIRYQGTYNSLYHRCYWVLCNFNGNEWKIFYLSFKMLLMCIFKNTCIKIKSVKSPFGFELIDEDDQGTNIYIVSKHDFFVCKNP